MNRAGACRCNVGGEPGNQLSRKTSWRVERLQQREVTGDGFVKRSDQHPRNVRSSYDLMNSYDMGIDQLLMEAQRRSGRNVLYDQNELSIRDSRRSRRRCAAQYRVAA